MTWLGDQEEDRWNKWAEPRFARWACKALQYKGRNRNVERAKWHYENERERQLKSDYGFTRT